MPNIQEGLVVRQNFTGCMENLYLNSTDVFGDMKEAFEYGESMRYEKVNTLKSCPVSIELLFCHSIVSNSTM